MSNAKGPDLSDARIDELRWQYMMSACPTIAEVRDFARAIRAEGSATDSPAERKSEDWRRLTGLWRYGARVLPHPKLSGDFYAWLAMLDALINDATGAQPVAAPEPLHGFSREDLEAVAEGLESQPQTVNVGNATGEGDDHLPSTAAVAAKFIRAILATQPGTEK
jgi:hypothetical protein